ncbi:hypothetical protein [Rhodoferax koreensis]|uniref:hypothetical protein n=1 Tax=Rhodoferax koreensis TaxID=1842727 RepID=UPI0012FFB5D9|nr:hypothetical protein [Rhodoferax koreense]
MKTPTLTATMGQQAAERLIKALSSPLRRIGYQAYTSEQSQEARGQYEYAEQEARAKRAGLWRDVEVTTPWDWRRGKRRLLLGNRLRNTATSRSTDAHEICELVLSATKGWPLQSRERQLQTDC